MYDHIGLRVSNLDTSLRFYTATIAAWATRFVGKMLHLPAFDRRVNPSVEVVCLS